MAVAIQNTSSSVQVQDNAGAINANLHFSVSEALTESKLLERVREYRRLSLDVSSVNSELSDEELNTRAHVMLQLKEAAEQFNTLISPVDVVHLQVLQELKLEQILSRYYWHTLFLANNHPEQGKYELDSLCSKLLNAKYSLSVVGFDIVNSAVEIDADIYTDADGQRITTPELPSISPEIFSVISPNPTTDITAHESGDLLIAETQPEAPERKPTGSGPISGLVTGVSALLLGVLGVSVFAPEFLSALQAQIPVGSLPYRLIMLAVLGILTSSCFIMISRLINAGSMQSVTDASAMNETESSTSAFNARASSRKKFAGFIAPILFGLGLGVATSAGLGSFGFAVLIEGLNKTFSIPVWQLIPIIAIGCWLTAWMLGRIPLGLGTFSTLLLVGPAIGVGAGFAPDGLSFNGNVMALVLGLILFAGGISLATAAAHGPDGLSALSLAAERKQKWPIPVSIILWDLTAIAAGVILGGGVGVATAVGLVAVPLLILMFLPAFRRVLQ